MDNLLYIPVRRRLQNRIPGCFQAKVSRVTRNYSGAINHARSRYTTNDLWGDVDRQLVHKAKAKELRYDCTPTFHQHSRDATAVEAV